jgi:hypothetical protein
MSEATLPVAVGDEEDSAVTWSAVFAGAVATLAMTFVLGSVAAGLGYRVPSPWPGVTGRADDFTPTLGAVMVLVQVLAYALGGYLTGRLRTKWKHVHDHEVFFRDTAHGLLAWALATVAGAILAGAVLGSSASRVAADTLTGRDADLASQFALFMGVGLLTSAFTAAVAAAIGGMRRDEMHTALRKG